MTTKISEQEAKRLRDYIALYCKNENHMEAVFYEIAGGGHKANDPFIKYMIPIIANRIAVEEAREQLEKLQKSLELITLNHLVKEQVKIRESISKIEEILYKAKETKITEQKSDKIILPFAITITIGILAFGIGALGVNQQPINNPAAQPPLQKSPASPAPQKPPGVNQQQINAPNPATQPPLQKSPASPPPQ